MNHLTNLFSRCRTGRLDAKGLLVAVEQWALEQGVAITRSDLRLTMWTQGAGEALGPGAHVDRIEDEAIVRAFLDAAGKPAVAAEKLLTVVAYRNPSLAERGSASSRDLTQKSSVRLTDLAPIEHVLTALYGYPRERVRTAIAVLEADGSGARRQRSDKR